VSNDDRDRALEKIKKLLALAKDDRGNINECEAAMRQAQALMRKWQIDETEAIQQEIATMDDALVAAWVKAGQMASKVVRKSNTGRGKTPEYAQWLAVATANLFDCKVGIHYIHEHGKVFMFYGYKHDVVVACWTFEYLLACIRRGSKAFNKAMNTGLKLDEWGITQYDAERMQFSTPVKRNTSFREGMSKGLCKRLRDMLADKKNHPIKGENALVVLKEDAIKKKFGDFCYKTSKAKDVHDLAAYSAGVTQARRTNINTAVDHTKDEKLRLSH